MENFKKIMWLFFATITEAIIEGFVFMKLWLWFVVPNFHVQPLGMAGSIGIILLISFVRARRGRGKSTEKFWEFLKNSLLFTVSASGLSLLWLDCNAISLNYSRIK